MARDSSGEFHHGKEFDLSERLARFGERVIRFARTLPVNPVTQRIITQLVGAGTGIGANYEESQEGESLRDFRHKVGIAKKESRETKYWLRMTAAAVPDRREEAAEIWKEAKEVHLILCRIVRSTDARVAKQ